MPLLPRDAEPGSHPARRLHGNRDAAVGHRSHRSHVVSHADRAGPPGGRRRRREKISVTVGLSLASSREIVWRPPGDKAIAQRAAFAAALSDGTSTIHNVPHSDDIEGNLGILRQLGVDIWEAADASYVIGGRGLRGLRCQRRDRL